MTALVSEEEDAVSAAEDAVTSSVPEDAETASDSEAEEDAVSAAEDAAAEAAEDAEEALLLPDPPQPASSAAAMDALNKMDTACFFIDYSSFKVNRICRTYPQLSRRSFILGCISMHSFT